MVNMRLTFEGVLMSSLLIVTEDSSLFEVWLEKCEIKVKEEKQVSCRVDKSQS